MEIYFLSLFSLVRQNAKRKEKIISPYSSLGHNCYGVEGMVVVGVRAGHIASTEPQSGAGNDEYLGSANSLSFQDHSL